MRLDSLLFVAVLFACFNTSLTRSSSTSVEPIASSQSDAPAYGFLRDGVETKKDERAFNLPGLDKAIEGTNSMTSKIVEKMLYWILRASRKNAMEAYKFLRLDKENSIKLRNARYNAWIRYLAKTTDTLPAELLGRNGDKDRLKMQNVLTKTNAREDAQAESKTTLAPSWHREETPAKDAFTLLKLDQPTEHKLYVKLLKMWVEYVRTRSNPDLEMKVVIAGYNDNTRLMILEGLREIEGTEEVVKPLQNSLMTSWINSKQSAKGVFTTLQLDKRGSKFNFDMWVMYVVQAFDTLQDTAGFKSEITELAGRYGDESLLKMFDALAEAGIGKDVQGELKSTLMASWKDKNMSAKEVLKLMELNLKPKLNDKVNVNRLRIWVQYVEENSSIPIIEMGVVLIRLELDIQVMILVGLKKIEGAKVVVTNLENTIVDRLMKREDLHEDRIVQVFRDLGLQNGLERLLQNPNLDLFKKFAKKFQPEISEEVSVITAFRDAYNDLQLGEMLEAAWRNHDETSIPLRRELFRQWHLDEKRNQLHIEEKMSENLRSSYKAYKASPT